ncbi:SMI1/KNR4 family protein [Adlercreutzia sp. ZJ304]|uniref:SMI1/KNR4 family protein n=1 Tax=Adlercreutzia sp. ZJ304 TaxID=2709791 RepID=UPI0013ECC151|nr:SMI1/KNR4 family protein [Adlercreutzia sp. ZJ304]
MYEQSVDLLKRRGIELESGLAADEIVQIEKIYEIVFPKSLRDFLMAALPVSNGFYDWRNGEQKNIERIKDAISRPMRDIHDTPEEVYWCEDWGEEPADEEVFKREVIERLKTAPKLIPVYFHRYMPMVSDENPPIMSVCGGDIIYYGADIQDYFEVEFDGKDQGAIDFESICPVPFWTDLV